METGFNDLGKFTNVRWWTLAAVECYNRGCVCKGCINETGFYENIFTKIKRPCQMKACVLESVRRFGKPTKAIIEKLKQAAGINYRLIKGF